LRDLSSTDGSIITKFHFDEIERVNSSPGDALAQSPRHNQCTGRGPWTTASIGGLVGLALGAGIIGVARLAIPGLPVKLSPWIVFTALGFSAAVGVVSGVIPARSAAALDPVEALRYE
jgi:hypothetical protein